MSSVKSEDEPKTLAIKTTNYPFGYPFMKTYNVIEKLESENFNLKLKIYHMKKLGNSNAVLPKPTCDYEREIMEIFEENKMLKIKLKKKQSELESAFKVIDFHQMEYSIDNESFVQTNQSYQETKNDELSKKIQLFILRDQISNMRIKIETLDQTSENQVKIIENQNYLIKALTVANLTFGLGLMCLIVLTRKL